MLRGPEEIWLSFLIVGAEKIATASVYFCLHIRGLDLSITKESFFCAPHASPTSAANMIKNDVSYLRSLSDTIGCIASGEVTPIYLWHADTSNLTNQKAQHGHIIIFSEIQLITYYATYLMTGGKVT